MLRIVVLLILLNSLNSYSDHVKFMFYTHDISIQSISNTNLKIPAKLDDEKLKSIYSIFENDRITQSVVFQLDTLVKNLDLSPWFAHKFIQSYLYKCFSLKNEMDCRI